ncbi:peptidoglycan bridge formation glycyltransferase FemA/FemB family protein [Suttonella sp. R2A3]|uniref:peptidoglycan bridge formation glycyltransferase FemA/FemB family protein n=1 Tax=Suttonella sp. R2A3 TaxID=2908648 RepID=UPI001F452710|nr:peptidoglycan bridge formation glycyltransferase FemA/FemB family protein [Suttonella sp. R2A3]UJF25328.1 peptidoglycan bridge formation glycyltransferase FemA/FemB family protein [Suttonella sp. R2A3]
MNCKKFNLLNDIYYQDSYSKLYLAGDGELFDYVFKDGEKYISFYSIKRKIENVYGVPVEEELYDLETPYGYGGPLTNSNDTAFLNSAFEAYRQHCIKEKIVCEFIRFHPFNTLSRHSSLFDFILKERTVVMVDLSLSTEARWAQYSKTTRNVLRKAYKKLSYEYGSKSFDDFKQLYDLTMNKNSAEEFYYFKPEYFEGLSSISGIELIEVKLDNDIVSSGFFMYGSDISHYHLSANNQSFMRENGNYLLLDCAFERAKEKGCRWMMLGGGRTADENDNLFKFKSKFSDVKLPFYIAGVDFMPEVRARLNKMWQNEHNDKITPKLFQLYRK